MNWLIKIFDIVAQPLIEWFTKKLKKPEPVSILKRREKLKNEFQKNILSKKHYGVTTDLIIRDIKRMDDYPEIVTKKKGISPYFKVELKGSYHKGIEVFICGPKYIKKDKNNDWVFTEYSDDSEKIKVIPIARIPYDLIEYVIWDGDEYHNSPIVFCKFEGVNSGPYEEIPFFTEHGSSEHTYFMEVKGFRPWDIRPRNKF